MRPRSIAIVAPPGRYRDGLRAIVKAMPGATVTTDDGHSIAEAPAGPGADIVLLDAGLPDGRAWDLLRRVKMGNASRCIVIANSRREEGMARSIGADGVLPGDFQAPQLYQMIERWSARD